MPEILQSKRDTEKQEMKGGNEGVGRQGENMLLFHLQLFWLGYSREQNNVY